MNAYLILIAYIFLIWFVTRKGTVLCKIGKANCDKMNLFLVLSFWAAFLLSALRNENVGTDTVSYVRYYQEVGRLKWSGLFNGGWDHHFFTTEKGFMILEKICSDLMIPVQAFIAICAGIFIYGVYKLAKTYTKSDALLTVVLFLAVGSYLLSINVMRQGIAVGLCCIAWIQLKKEKRLQFILEVLLACSFHVSCCVFFLAILFERIPAGRRSVLICTAAMVIFGFAGAAALPVILRWFPVYAVRYGNGRWKINEANGIVIVWCTVVAIALISAFLKDWAKKESHIDFEIILISLCYVSINIIGLGFDGAQRLSMLFQPFLILLFNRSSRLWGGITRKIYTVGVTSGMLVLFLRAASTTQYVYTPFWA